MRMTLFLHPSVCVHLSGLLGGIGDIDRWHYSLGSDVVWYRLYLQFAEGRYVSAGQRSETTVRLEANDSL